MAKPPRVLLIEDSPSIAEIYLGYLRWEPYQVTHVSTGAEALAVLERELPHAILLDLNLPDMNGMEILHEVVRRGLPSSVVIITAHGSVDVAVEAMRSGAFDFLVKPFKADRLLVTLRNALDKQQPLNWRESKPQAIVKAPAGETSMAKLAWTMRALRQLEREAIEEAIALCGGNIPKAAALLNISVTTIHRKIKMRIQAS